MSEVGQRPPRVGVRELRQNLSVYLDRVKDGERLVVTEHGQPVAELTPLASGSVSTLERLIAEGRARPAKGNLALLGSPPPVRRPPGSRSVSEELVALRDEDPW
jgi:prevent-host-death family protein